MTPPLPTSERGRRTEDSPISYFMQQAIENPDLISLAAGLVDQPSLPAEEIAEAVAELAKDPHAMRVALQYGTTEGLYALRDQVLRHACDADHLAPSELNLSIEDVVLTSGSQQLLYLISEALLDPGDIVLTESPSYFVYHGVLKSMGVRAIPVPMDEHGMITEALEEKLEHLSRTGELSRVKMIYTVDYFQNPSGLTLAESRRGPLVEIARQYSRNHRILILEDAAYRELRFGNEDLPSVKSFDPKNEYVVTTYTFSKPCAPGLKTGYGLMPRDLATVLSRIKGNHDFGSNNFAQHLIMRMLRNGTYYRHVEVLRDVYRSKRDAMLQALDVEFGSVPGVSWTRPEGGLYVWARFPMLDTGPRSKMAQEALRNGVLYVPGEFGHVSEDGEVPTCEMRLSYGNVAESAIAEGIHRLRKAYDVASARTGSPSYSGAL